MHKALLVGSIADDILWLQSYFRKKNLKIIGVVGETGENISLPIHMYFFGVLITVVSKLQTENLWGDGWWVFIMELDNNIYKARVNKQQKKMCLNNNDINFLQGTWSNRHNNASESDTVRLGE